MIDHRRGTAPVLQANNAKFMTPLTVTLRELLVAVPTRTEDGKDVFSAATTRPRKARSRPAQARVRGEDFAALVAEAVRVGDQGQRRPDWPGQRRRPRVRRSRTSSTPLEPGDVTRRCAARAGIRSSSSRLAATPGSSRFDKVRERDRAAPCATSASSRRPRRCWPACVRRPSSSGKTTTSASSTSRHAGGQPAASEDRHRLARPSGRAGADGRHDRHGLPPPREAQGRLRTGRDRDGQLGGARPRHRSARSSTPSTPRKNGRSPSRSSAAIRP